MKEQGDAYENFYCQVGYFIISVRPIELDTLIRYIEQRRARHTRKCFQAEVRALCRKFQIECDERYMWD